MNDRRLLRLTAGAAVVGPLAMVVAALMEPGLDGGPAEAVLVVADSGTWIGGRVLYLIGLFLTVAAFTLVGSTFAESRGRQWARVGQPFLILVGALGAGAIVSGANMKELADSWAGAAPASRQPYLAAFDAAGNATDDLTWATLLALGAYLAALGAAILIGGVYVRRLGWAAAVAGALLVGATCSSSYSTRRSSPCSPASR